MTERPFRVMWLLNHSTARKFELPQLKRNGITEIFMPKKLVQNVIFRSASVDWTEDKNLTIPPEDLAAMNEVDWYGEIDDNIWPIVNKHFDLMFFIFVKPEQFMSFAKHFKGAMIWRVYGRELNQSYSAIMKHYFHGTEDSILARLGKRFWLGEAYEHLHKIEGDKIKQQALFLPLGLQDASLKDQWTGDTNKVFFVCPDIGVASYYREIYEEFKKDFGDFPHAIGGNQPIKLPDDTVLGFVTLEEHEHNMRSMKLMYYHSSEPNHIHYHPFEAIRAGMPLIFMSGGILDRFGGKGLPGRCTSMEMARAKIKRILDGDKKFIEQVRSSQIVLLDPMRVENCEAAWTEGLQLVRGELAHIRAQEKPVAIAVEKPPRIAVILPLEYRGGTLRAAKLVASAIRKGAEADGKNVEVVFAHVENPEVYNKDDFDDLDPAIKPRPFKWEPINPERSRNAMHFIGNDWNGAEELYIFPQDNMQQLMDSDFWVIISDRMGKMLLPVRPYAMVVFDYLQRYQPVLLPGSDAPFLRAAKLARKVLVTTEQTEMDALQYANIPKENIARVPMLVPDFSVQKNEKPTTVKQKKTEPYFIWTTNLAPHKNHLNAFKALRIYYEDLDGQLDCFMTGVNTQYFLTADAPNLHLAKQVHGQSRLLRRKLKIMGDLSETQYRKTLRSAQFLWHPAVIDNGTFSVIEAAQSGVPALSSDYPAMHEINNRFKLNLQWMDADKPVEMANALKNIELQGAVLKKKLPAASKITAEVQDIQQSLAYWKVIKQCL